MNLGLHEISLDISKYTRILLKKIKNTLQGGTYEREITTGTATNYSNFGFYNPVFGGRVDGFAGNYLYGCNINHSKNCFVEETK